MADYREIWRPPELSQPEHGYRFTTDAFALASFALTFPFTNFCDLGTGSGVIAHDLATRRPTCRGVAVERQASLLAHARRNLADLPVHLIEGDLRAHDWSQHRFELVVCNPPYYEVHAGGINRCPERAAARHTFHGTAVDFAAALAPALREDGVFCLVFPDHLIPRLLTRFERQGWFLRRRLDLCSYADRAPKLACLALGRGAGSQPRRQRISVWRAHREFTDEMQFFLRDASLPPDMVDN